MKSIFIGLLLMLSSSSVLAIGKSGAKPPFLLNLYVLNAEARFEKGLSQNIESRNAVNNFAAGGRYGATSILFEYSLFTRSTGNAMLSVESARREYLMWWKQSLHAFEYVDLFSTLGIGGYQEEVRTRLSGSAVTDQGESSAMAGAGLGFGTVLMRHLVLSLEGRLLAGSNFDPNPSAGILFRSGFEF